MIIVDAEDSKPPIVPSPQDREQQDPAQHPHPHQIQAQAQAQAPGAAPLAVSLNGYFGPAVQPPRSSSSSSSHWPRSYGNTPSYPYHTDRIAPAAPPVRPAPSPPPSYPKYQHHPASPPPPSPLGTTHAAAVLYRQSPVTRFWKAFALALLIYLAMMSLAGTTIRYGMGPGGVHRSHAPGNAGPKPEDGRVIQSIDHGDWSSHQTYPRWAPNFSGSAKTSFLLPMSSQELYLISRGAGGQVKVQQSAEQGGDNVRVDVRVAYRDEQALRRATVCRLHKSGDKEGVGIYTSPPERPSWNDQLYFDVVFTFPAAKSVDVPLRVHALTTHTDNFAYEIGDLWQSILFDDVNLGTSNGPIQVGSLTLTRGSMISTNGRIVGHFNASDALVLHTSNAAIEASASLFSAGGNASAVTLDMRTSNSPITSSVSLTTESGSGGHFAVAAHSSNGRIQLQYDDVPLRARLISDVKTSNSAAAVVMHPAYEGAYEVSTSNSRAVARNNNPADPSGAGRRRIVNQTRVRNTVSGTVFWAENEGTRRGAGNTCTVRTSNGGATLDL